MAENSESEWKRIYLISKILREVYNEVVLQYKFLKIEILRKFFLNNTFTNRETIKYNIKCFYKTITNTKNNNQKIFVLYKRKYFLKNHKTGKLLSYFFIITTPTYTTFFQMENKINENGASVLKGLFSFACHATSLPFPILRSICYFLYYLNPMI